MHTSQYYQLLQQAFNIFKNELRKEPDKNRLRHFGLNLHSAKTRDIEIGYNTGKVLTKDNDLDFIKQCLEAGLLMKSTAGYHEFGSSKFIFPLRDKENRIVNLYAIKPRYLIDLYLNKEGFFPTYPDIKAEKLLIVSNPIEACIAMQHPFTKKHTTLSLDEFRLTEEFISAIKILPSLKEICFVGKRINEKSLSEQITLLNAELPYINIIIKNTLDERD
jgi:hypothetical protein